MVGGNQINLVIGLGFGDEGKGSTVNSLCRISDNPMVVRFNGGHQVGHTVHSGDNRHVFSNFGSGTLNNVPTYWSRFCTVNPVAIYNEHQALISMDVNPDLIIDENAMVTTPFDIVKNHRLEMTNKHGSIGVGFGTTIQRNEDMFHLYARDLLYPEILRMKLNLIQDVYYRYSFSGVDIANKDSFSSRMKLLLDEFLIACEYVVDHFRITKPSSVDFNRDLIFEGGQGILLDMDYGFFPNVTRSNTTSKNAMQFIDENNIKGDLETYYITRAYQTRHGNGYMSNVDLDTSYIKENPNETNISNKFQGDFRKSVLDIDLLDYSIRCDKYHNKTIDDYTIVLTCLDQVPEKFPVTFDKIVNYVDIDDLTSILITPIISSYSDKGW